jgi:hypothetical protein
MQGARTPQRAAALRRGAAAAAAARTRARAARPRGRRRPGPGTHRTAPQSSATENDAKKHTPEQRVTCGGIAAHAAHSCSLLH